MVPASTRGASCDRWACLSIEPRVTVRAKTSQTPRGQRHGVGGRFRYRMAIHRRRATRTLDKSGFASTRSTALRIARCQSARIHAPSRGGQDAASGSGVRHRGALHTSRSLRYARWCERETGSVRLTACHLRSLAVGPKTAGGRKKAGGPKKRDKCRVARSSAVSATRVARITLRRRSSAG